MLNHFIITNYQQSKRFMWLGLLSCILSFSSAADNTLYTAISPVPDQTETERKIALTTALQRVLVKLTGHANITNNQAIQPILTQAPQYVQQFHYQTSPQSEAQQQLWIQFDQQAINQALINSGIPIWQPPRPNTLVWLAIEDDQKQRLLLNYEHQAKWSQRLQTAISQYGLSIILPLLDLTDQSIIRFSDVWGGFMDTIIQASARYQANTILVGKLHTVKNQWQVIWKLYHNGKVLKRWQSINSDPNQLLDESMQTLSAALYQNFAPKTVANKQGTILLYVANISTFNDYLYSLEYLKSLHALKNIRAYRLEANNVTFQAELYGSLSDLERSISMRPILEALPANTEQTEQNTLYFRLITR